MGVHLTFNISECIEVGLSRALIESLSLSANGDKLEKNQGDGSPPPSAQGGLDVGKAFPTFRSCVKGPEP